MALEFTINGGDFDAAGKAASKIKNYLKQRQVPPTLIKRMVVAIYEAEVNVVAHAHNGILRLTPVPGSILVEVKDKGPGIANIEQAMTAGFSTASQKVREMGFGAGMGLQNIRKNSDEFNIESSVGEGTTVRLRFYIDTIEK